MYLITNLQARKNGKQKKDYMICVQQSRVPTFFLNTLSTSETNTKKSFKKIYVCVYC